MGYALRSAHALFTLHANGIYTMCDDYGWQHDFAVQMPHHNNNNNNNASATRHKKVMRIGRTILYTNITHNGDSLIY